MGTIFAALGTVTYLEEKMFANYHRFIQKNLMAFLFVTIFNF